MLTSLPFTVWRDSDRSPIILFSFYLFDLTEEQLISLIFDLFIAGGDTTGNAIGPF
jgi:hypothetical protein